MKTKKSFHGLVSYLIFVCCICLPLSAQTPEPTDSGEEVEEVVDPRPEETDDASEQLIQNYLTATGGKDQHHAIHNIVAEGTIKESTLVRNFRLIETNDGKRHLTYWWTHRGRDHRVVYVFDGLETWTQQLSPEELPAKPYSGIDGIHFSTVRWLIQPFTLPSIADFVFKYQGGSDVGGRPAYVIKGYGKKDVPSWFYFDKEQSLVVRWGSLGQIAGVEEYMDYQATRFRSVNGVMFPTEISLLAENETFGRIEFDQITVNEDLNDLSFFMPATISPTLRQRPAPSN